MTITYTTEYVLIDDNGDEAFRFDSFQSFSNFATNNFKDNMNNYLESQDIPKSKYVIKNYNDFDMNKLEDVILYFSIADMATMIVHDFEEVK